MAKKATTPKAGVRFPLVDPPGYVSRHVQVRFDAEHARMFNELACGLKTTGAALAGGKEVDGLADTVRYLVEHAHAAGERIGRSAA